MMLPASVSASITSRPGPKVARSRAVRGILGEKARKRQISGSVATDYQLQKEDAREDRRL
jgi:hypothetical protein